MPSRTTALHQDCLLSSAAFKSRLSFGKSEVLLHEMPQGFHFLFGQIFFRCVRVARLEFTRYPTAMIASRL